MTGRFQLHESHDRIALTGLKAYGYHGVFDHEKAQGQDFYIDLIVHGSVSAAAASDDLADTVDYGALANVAVQIVEGEPFDLIEKLAAVIAERLLDYCADIEVTVHKPQAPIAHEFRDVAVSVRRSRGATGTLPGGTSAAGAAASAQAANTGGTAVLSLGGNVGDTRRQIADALASLDLHPRIKVLQRSANFVTSPVGGVEQPDFINVTAVVSTSLPAREFLAVCQGIEVSHGRTRDIRWGPRTLDIDLIRFTPVDADIDDPAAELIMDSAVLTLPHPRAHERAFVLAPWAQIRPGARITVGANETAEGGTAGANEPAGPRGVSAEGAAGTRSVGELAAELMTQQQVHAADENVQSAPEPAPESGSGD